MIKFMVGMFVVALCVMYIISFWYPFGTRPAISFDPVDMILDADETIEKFIQENNIPKETLERATTYLKEVKASIQSNEIGINKDDATSSVKKTSDPNSDKLQTDEDDPESTENTTDFNPEASRIESAGKIAGKAIAATVEKVKVAEEFLQNLTINSLTDKRFLGSLTLSRLLKKIMTQEFRKEFLLFGERQVAKVAGVLSKLAFDSAGEVVGKFGVKLGEMAAGVALGPAGMLVEVLEKLALLDYLWDPAGFAQFSSNKDINTEIRRNYEILWIQDRLRKGKDPPFVFSLAHTAASPTLAPIGYAFNQAIATYFTSSIPEAIESFSDDRIRELLQKITNEEDDDEFSKLLTDEAMKSFEDPKKRDETFLEYMNEQLSSDLRQYVALDTDYSLPNWSAVTLSQKGVEIFNEETIDNESVQVIGLYSKYYRKLDERGRLVTENLPSPIAQESQLKMLMRMCTKTEELQKNEIKSLPRLNLDPAKYGVQFNQDTCLCKYTKAYCERVGMKYVDDNSDGMGLPYSDCKDLPGAGMLSLFLSNTLVHGVVSLGEKASHIGDLFKTSQSEALDKYETDDPQYVNKNRLLWEGLQSEGEHDASFDENEAARVAREEFEKRKAHHESDTSKNRSPINVLTIDSRQFVVEGVKRAYISIDGGSVNYNDNNTHSYVLSDLSITDKNYDNMCTLQLIKLGPERTITVYKNFVDPVWFFTFGWHNQTLDDVKFGYASSDKIVFSLEPVFKEGKHYALYINLRNSNLEISLYTNFFGNQRMNDCGVIPAGLIAPQQKTTNN